MARCSRESTSAWVYIAAAFIVVLLALFPGLRAINDQYRQATRVPLNTTTLIVMATAVAFGAAAVGLILLPNLPAYIRARRAGVPLPLTELIGMRFRRTPVNAIIAAAQRANEERLQISPRDLEVHSLAGGDPLACVEALAESRRRGFPAEWSDITALDLAGRDALAVAKSGVDPRRVIGVKEYGDRWAKPSRS
jgi:uncharacterized protein YqfA (UPF0365 family)